MSKELSKEREIMRMHALPGKIVREFVIPAKEYAALTLREGQTLRFVDIEGKQVPDVVCFNERDLSEELNLGNSLLINKRREFVKGNVLYSVICNPMMTITGYSNALSYAYGPMCSEEVNRMRYGIAGTRNCRDNFAMALKDWGFSARRIPNAFVPFMRVEVEPDGTMEIKEPTSKPGDYYDLRAEMDLVVGISNCPQERNPCNGFKPTATGILVYES
ncbi:MAG TPA: urea carboxylase-associated family protein [Burkholderiales bacterium]|nr:urea carboxylase-associated family protein [Burkholderiales bacterium]